MSLQPLTLQPPRSEGTEGGKDHRGPAAQPLRASQLTGQSEQEGGRVNRRDTEGTRNTGPMSSMTAHHRPGDGTSAPMGTGYSLNVS